MMFEQFIILSINIMIIATVYPATLSVIDKVGGY